MKQLLTIAVLFALAVPFATKAFEPNDWYCIRDNEGVNMLTYGAPTRSTSTPAMLGGQIDGDNCRWYYAGRGLRAQASGNDEHWAGNYDLEVDLTDFSIFDIPDATDIIAGKVGTTTYSSNLTSLWNAIVPLEAFKSEFLDNINDEENTFHVSHTSTAAGLMSKAEHEKLAGLHNICETGDYEDLENLPTLATVATTGSYDDLTDKPTIPGITAQPHISDASTNASTTAATNGATNAATNLTADSVTILGISVPTNASYASLVSAHNDLATKYNALAVKYNDAATKYNDAATKYNAAAEKLNAIIDALEANGILTQ